LLRESQYFLFQIMTHIYLLPRDLRSRGVSTWDTIHVTEGPIETYITTIPVIEDHGVKGLFKVHSFIT
jgi:hypothetical protein